MDEIRIRGARTHNLKNISLDLPRHKLVVMTGVSGSGKSSLAFDTLYAEGQRRYVESLSAYARQFLQLMDKPDVDLIEGLSPAIAIEQKSAGHNPRSTVGTVTEIHDYLRLLYARVGTPYCPEHGEPLEAQSVAQMVDAVLAMPEESRIAILAPVAHDRKGSFEAECANLQAQGYVRLRLDGEMTDIDSMPALDPNTRHSLDVVVDRLRVRAGVRSRLAESLETALALSQGRILLLDMDNNAEQVFSSRYACPVCSRGLTELEPRLFSFNNPMGACPCCDGLGQVGVFDAKRIVAFPELSLASGAIKGWDRRNAFAFNMLNSLATHYGFDLETPFEALPEDVRGIVLNGSGSEEIEFAYLNEKGRSTVRRHPFEGIIPNLERRWRETDSSAVREELEKFRSIQTCPECGGSRLRAEARHVRIGHDMPPGERLGQETGLAIYEVEAMPLAACQNWFDNLALEGARQEIAARIVNEISARLRFLNNVGLGYLSLDRSATTISGGEAQRIRLASQIGSGLTGVMYVLDEPSIGLHQRDNDRLISTLKHLRDLGNSVIVVEHDEDMIREADWVVDMGPGAGEHGGTVTAQGTPADIQTQPASLTGQYLNGTRAVAVPQRRAVDDDTRWLELSGCTGNNLKNVDLRLPVGKLVCVAGVSGSGKSTLVNDTLARVAAMALNRAQEEPAPYAAITGLEHFDKIITVDQSPIGRTPRSNPATYTGLFTPMRELFAGVPESRARGYDPGRFSFNVKGGRCEACQGDGVVKVEMHFLPDMYVPCDTCQGKRYNRETLEIRYRGRNISEVLDLTVEQALEYFEAVPAIARRLQTLADVGLSYIRLGQSATTLSGGEAQRVKLSLELARRGTGKTLYVLDEPTTGLHFQDIQMLLQVLNQLVEAGNTVLVIEHNLDVIKTADWVIDMGPEGGQGGGRIVAQGTPEAIAATDSPTAPYLQRVLSMAI
ncbi:excinuclease ABC subunit UvrA [Kerstersia gyiorum]|uniref:UvrABC system protein A n=1 Tax=Kerstersia gyiorum TaxID=206506 RepID=A0A171KWV4_9BURK|nr:excinuclease ABC subunit UvrA [Kerstersia gyiorum]MCO7635961.1 excinuclease ABC subunit UvrA [Pseudomonas sp. S 311-6]KAB0544807.1 excinuclease ABC subunit UvrA [Kerstersia gyiorum]KKO73371.1 excinuclease ABC subunit A [Kerstersia gyiorum]MCP1632043.1 excinuclease ABC subunit A [Kerstersia gyiorum]MCP1635448.1 excinuclease ABC subunit A [Kerstersia gyiorum]